MEIFNIRYVTLGFFFHVHLLPSLVYQVMNRCTEFSDSLNGLHIFASNTATVKSSFVLNVLFNLSGVITKLGTEFLEVMLMNLKPQFKKSHQNCFMLSPICCTSWLPLLIQTISWKEVRKNFPSLMNFSKNFHRKRKTILWKVT